MPDLLSPAGNWECARAAVANGADAIYFGLPAFNARLRADNFTREDLPALMEFLHAHGVRGFVTMNTLIFTDELQRAEDQLRALNEAGVDAVIVQDIGLARLARILAPAVEVHASTQMTITSPEGLNFIHRHIGLDLAVIARENSLREMRLFHADKPGAVPLETFVHGALCVAYSGQCLTSESLGKRSANRGECAQACRMPYELIVDGELRELGDKRYLLSPQDLAAIDEIPKLTEAGISSFKIEGRLKSPEYVAAVTRAYRKAIDNVPVEESDRHAMEMTFSRGFYSGWLHGVNHQELVTARFGKKRGAFVGKIEEVGDRSITVRPRTPLKPGDGIVFDTGGDTNREQGGRIYQIQTGKSGSELFFKHGHIQFGELQLGHRIWKTDDPAINQELRKTWSSEIQSKKRFPIDIRVSGRAGERLEAEEVGSGVRVKSDTILEHARTRPLGEDILRKQLGRLGETAYELRSLDNSLKGEVMLPVSALNRTRRALVSALDEERATNEGKAHCRKQAPAGASYHDLIPERTQVLEETPSLSVLCRDMPQLEVAMELGVPRVLLDFEDVRRYRNAVDRFRDQAVEGTSIILAIPRIQKAGEDGYFKVVERAKPDGVLIRNLGGVDYFRTRDHLERIGDFSLNVANPISASFFKNEGNLDRLTISYDLNIDQVLSLVRNAPPDWFELTLHQHMPMFHMEHCVFCAFMSEGTDYTNCGRPCETHKVELRDRVGQLHPLTADVGCRNTLFNGKAQTGARYYTELVEAGTRRFRVELLRENEVETRRIIQAYQSLLRGDDSGTTLWKTLQAHSRLGVTEGTLNAS